MDEQKSVKVYKQDKKQHIRDSLQSTYIEEMTPDN